MRAALEGEAVTDVQKVNDRWFYRRSVPLNNTLHTACVLGRANFAAEFFAQVKTILANGSVR